MSSRHLASGNDGERGRAVQRLHAAVAEQSRTHEAVESAGKQDDVQANASIRAANDQVAARQAWLKAVDDYS